MAVVRTFDPKIDLSGAYLGGQRIKLGREQLEQEAASDAARIQLGYAELQRRAVDNEMKLAAEKDVLSREALQKAQEAEIEKSYKETQFGLERRRLEDDERNTMMKVEEAARGMQVEQEFSRRVKAGESADKVMQELGFGMPGHAASFRGPTVPNQLPAFNAARLMLNDEERSIRQKYGNQTWKLKDNPEDMKRLAAIQKKRSEMELPSSQPQMTVSSGVISAPSQQWLVPPSEIPTGAPLSGSFMGDPMAPTGPPTYGGLPQLQPIQSSSAAARAKRRVLEIIEEGK